MRRTSAVIIIGLLALAGCSSSNDNAGSDPGAPTSSTTTSVVVSSDNAAVCAGFSQVEAARAAGAPKASGSDLAASAASMQAYLTSLKAPLEAVKAAAPTDLVGAVDRLILNIDEAGALDPTNPTDQQTLIGLVLTPDEASTADLEAVSSWSVVNCGISLGVAP